MARKTKQQKATEAAIDAAFAKYGSNRQYGVFDLSKITAAGQKAADLGQDIEAAVQAACDQYEIKK
jgi:hypothetical protein